MNKKSKLKNKDFKKGLIILKKYAFAYKKELIKLSILGILLAIVDGVVPFIMGRFFDSLIKPADFNGLTVFNFSIPFWLFLLILFIIFQIAQNFITWKKGLQANILWDSLFSNYQAQAINRLINKQFSFFKNQKTGEILQRLDKARNAVANTVGETFPMFFPQIISVLVGLIISIYINLILATVLTIGVIIYLNIIFFTLQKIERLSKKGNKIWGKIFSQNHEIIANILEIKKNNTEQKEKKKNKYNFLKTGFNLEQQFSRLWTQIEFTQNIIITLTRIAIFIISTIFVFNKTITVGELIMFNAYAGMFFGPFIWLSQKWLEIFKGIIEINYAEILLNKPEEIYEPKNKINLSEIKGAVEFKNASFYYQKKDGTILENISFKVSTGQTVALVGESGVGKSTIIDLIGAFYFPQKGDVLIDNVSTKKISLNLLRSNISFVSQDITLFNDTILNNIKYGSKNASTEEIEKAAELAYCDKFIQKFPKKYQQIVGEKGIKLSGGQKQKIAIARAILRNTKILILDEPTSSLDIKSEKDIMESLQKLMKGKTTFIIAHRLSTVRNVDQIFVFKEKKLIEQGTYSELVKNKNGEFKKMTDLHLGLN